MTIRVLVAGKSGQVAQAMADAASRRNDAQVYLAGRPILDLLNPATIERVLDGTAADVVVNAGAYTAVDKAETDADRCFALNRDGAGFLAAAAARRRLPIVHISTDYVFDGEKGSPYAEGDLAAPMTVYGASKLAGEEAVRSANPRHVILRTAWVYSPFGNNFVRTMLRLARERREISIVADQYGSPTHASHLADALIRVARQAAGQPRDWPCWGVHHAAGAGEASWRDLACEAFAVSSRFGGAVARVIPIGGVDYPTAARRPRNSTLNSGKLARAFGIDFPDWRIGVAACVEKIVNGGG